MKRTIKLLLLAVAILAVLCTGAWAAIIPPGIHDDDVTWITGTYTLAGNATYTKRIIVSGDVTLMLTDGFTLTAEGGIDVGGYLDGGVVIQNSLTIEGGPLGTGRLIATHQRTGDAPIGSEFGRPGGKITINGGTVTATSTGENPAIGGANSYGASTITINGGIVTARSSGGDKPAAIGGGNAMVDYGSGDGGKITINGGVVEAIAEAGAGIGCGNGGETADITITGGKVKATSMWAAGIGGAAQQWDPYNGTIKIEGGEVIAISLSGGAGIGGGDGVSGGTITITGGTVVASANGGAGIGGGERDGGGTITILCGTVETSSVYGAGIGGGSYGGSGGDIKILGGVVTAKSTNGRGIGGGDGATDHGTLASGSDGGAWIDTSSVGASTQGFTSGVLIDGDKGTTRGKTVIPAGTTATLRHGVELTIEDDADIVNDGELYLPISVTKDDIKSMKITGTGRTYWNGKLIHPDGEFNYDEAIAESSKIFADGSNAWTPDDGDWEIAIIMEDDAVQVSSISIDDEPLDDMEWRIRAARSGELSAKASVRTVVISAATLSSFARETAPTSHDLRITMTDDGYADMTFWVGTQNASGGGSSGGVCSSGAAALVALAALAMIKRRKR